MAYKEEFRQEECVICYERTYMLEYDCGHQICPDCILEMSDRCAICRKIRTSLRLPKLKDSSIKGIFKDLDKFKNYVKGLKKLRRSYNYRGKNYILDNYKRIIKELAHKITKTISKGKIKYNEKILKIIKFGKRQLNILEYHKSLQKNKIRITKRDLKQDRLFDKINKSIGENEIHKKICELDEKHKIKNHKYSIDIYKTKIKDDESGNKWSILEYYLIENGIYGVEMIWDIIKDDRKQIDKICVIYSKLNKTGENYIIEDEAKKLRTRCQREYGLDMDDASETIITLLVHSTDRTWSQVMNGSKIWRINSYIDINTLHNGFKQKYGFGWEIYGYLGNILKEHRGKIMIFGDRLRYDHDYFMAIFREKYS